MEILIGVMSVILTLCKFVITDVSFYGYVRVDVYCILDDQDSSPVKSVLHCATKCNQQENVAFHTQRVARNNSVWKWSCVCLNRIPDSTTSVIQPSKLYIKRNHSVSLQSWIKGCMKSSTLPYETETVASSTITSDKTSVSTSHSTQRSTTADFTYFSTSLSTQRPTYAELTSFSTSKLTERSTDVDLTSFSTSQSTERSTDADLTSFSTSQSTERSTGAELTSFSTSRSHKLEFLETTENGILSTQEMSSTVAMTTAELTIFMPTAPPSSSCRVDAALRFDNGTIWLFSEGWIYQYTEWNQIKRGRTGAISVLSVFDVSGPIDAAYANSTNIHIIKGIQILVYSIDAKPVRVETRSTTEHFGRSSPSDVNCVLKSSLRFYVFSSSILYDVSASSSITFTNNANKNPLRSTNQNQNPGAMDACCNINTDTDLYFVGYKHLTFQQGSGNKGTWGETGESIC